MGRHRYDVTRRKPTSPTSLIAAAGAAALLVLGGSGIAMADPDFGPGSSAKGPQDAGAICHPPGQTAEFPAC